MFYLVLFSFTGLFFLLVNQTFLFHRVTGFYRVFFLFFSPTFIIYWSIVSGFGPFVFLSTVIEFYLNANDVPSMVASSKSVIRF